MPTYTPAESFLRDFRALSVEQKEAFRGALKHSIEDLESGRFRAGLRVEGIQGMPGCFEMTWARDGRAIFTYGPEVRAGERHVMWLAIGTHAHEARLQRAGLAISGQMRSGWEGWAPTRFQT